MPLPARPAPPRPHPQPRAAGRPPAWRPALALLLAAALAGCVATAPVAPPAAAKPAGPVSAVNLPMMLAEPAWAPSRMAAPPAAAKGSAAYQLDSCKPAEGWEMLVGNCSSNASFSGQGAAARASLIYIGRFSNGLPDGAGSLCFQSRSREQVQREGQVACDSQYLSCHVQFKAGRLAGDTLQCRAAGRNRDADLLLQVRSATGFQIDDGLRQSEKDGFGGRAAAITADLAEVDIRNRVSWGLVHTGAQAPSRATGTVRQLQLRGSRQLLSRFAGTLTMPASRDARNNSQGEMVIKGVLDAEGADQFTFTFRPADFRWEVGDAVPREALLEVRHNELAYQLVFMPANKRPAYGEPPAVLYFKDNAGIEFDATPAECWAKGERGGAWLRTPNDAGSGRFAGYGLDPRCGKMSTPTGTYTGRFRNGKPV
jgi:hypothetical protein